MNIETDSLGDPKAEWIFCGVFPLAEIAKGRRACRKGWRNVPDEMDMLAVVLCSNNDETSSLGLERESADAIEETETFSDVEDMLANDWYLEKDESDSTPMVTNSHLVPEDKIVATIEDLLAQPFWLHQLQTMIWYERLHDDHDGTNEGKLCVMFSPDGGARVLITSIHQGEALRFRTPGGGGNSFRTRVALLILAYAIKLDAEKPIR